MNRIALLASGSGSNVENIFNYFNVRKTLDFPLVLSNNEHAYVHERAQKMGIPSYFFTKNEFAEAKLVLDLLQKYAIDGIVLAGFMLKISQPLLDAFPNKIINIHPALLPKYGGKGMYGHHVHEAVKNAGETETGITIHYINENYDEGNIIFQAKCPVLPTDTPEDIAAKVHELEYRYYPEIIEQVFG